MQEIYVDELETPEAFVMRRIATTVGLNVRPEAAVFDKNTGLWTVPLKAIFPSQVTSKNDTIRTFLYEFKNLGNVQLIKEKGNFKFVKFPKVTDIDNELHDQWYDLTQKIEQEILRIGESFWGELTYLKMLLRPMYTVIGEVITGHKLYFNELIKTPQQLKYVNFLRSKDYLVFDNRTNTYSASQFLTKAAEELFKRYNDEAFDFTITSRIVGSIFAKHYREIKNTLGVHTPSVYVDTSRAYYLDAIRVGESINMGMEELWRKYRMIGHRNIVEKVGSNYPSVISELVLGKLLNKNDEENYVFANEMAFRKLAPLATEFSKQLVEIP